MNKKSGYTLIWSLASCLCAVMLVACGGGGGGGSSSDPAPSVSASSFSPLGFQFTGGTITASGTVTDNNAVTSVQIQATETTGATVIASVTATQSVTDESVWSGSMTFPLNENTNNQDHTYSVVLVASDASGNVTTSAAATITVEAMERPPEPPTF